MSEKSASEKKEITVRCPRCGGPALYSASNAYRPFCSERCSLIDLGRWANEEFKVPTEGDISEDEIPSESSDEGE